MKTSRLNIGIGLAAAMLLAAPSAAASIMLDPVPEAPKGRRNRRADRNAHKPSGSTPVPGGGRRQQLRTITRDVKAWVERIEADDGQVAEIDVRAYLRSKWPGTDYEMQDAVVAQFFELKGAR